MSIQVAPWMPAVEAQIQAHQGLDRMVKTNVLPESEYSFKRDMALLGHADPYSWSAETVQAALTASRAVPADTQLNFYNLQAGPSWWHLAKPLPFQTVTQSDTAIRGILFGWVATTPKTMKFPAGTPIDRLNHFLSEGCVPKDFLQREFSISCFVDDGRFGIGPSQVFNWRDNETLEEMLIRIRRDHQRLYGPGGIFQHKPQVGEDIFMAAAEGVGRFILAGLSWLRQRVVVETKGHIERHRRKELARRTGNQGTLVKVVQLRHAEHKKSVVETDEERAHREWSCRWMVGLDTNGFWRNQACGTGMKNRRLTYIAPYMKGPDDKPLKQTQPKVYVVNR